MLFLFIQFFPDSERLTENVPSPVKITLVLENTCDSQAIIIDRPVLATKSVSRPIHATPVSNSSPAPNVILIGATTPICPATQTNNQLKM